MGDQRGLTPEQLAEAKRRYEAGEAMASIARTLNVRRPTLIAARNRAGQDGQPWTVHPSVQVSAVESKAVRERATAQVIDIATKRAVEQMEQNGGIDAQAAMIGELLRMQAPLYAKAAKLIDSTLDKAIAGQLKLGVTQGDTTALNDLLGALSKFSKDTRTGAGIQDGTPTIGAGSGEDERVEQAVLVVRDHKTA